MSIMPELPFDRMVAGCTEGDGNRGRIVFGAGRLICAARNSRTGRLRASKPFGRIDFHGDENEALFKACANYVWRMLCFDFVSYRPHSCMPCTADFDIGAVYHLREQRGDYSNRDERRQAERVLRDSLDALIKRAESVLPITEQKGAMAWVRLLGLYEF